MGELEKDIYLNRKLKDYYQKDFEENVLKCPVDSWKLDANTEEILTKINQNPRIQTLYSKRYHPDPNILSTNPESYIKFAYSKDIEMWLFKVFIPNTTTTFNEPLLGSSNCYHSFNYPRENPNYIEREEDKFKVKCLVDKDYFRINHFAVYLHCDNYEKHNEFWEYLKKELMEAS